ncbi:toprim domain-containing protein, partial [Pseudomonas aeruginosa]
AQQGPAMTPREEFAQAMRSAGLFVGQRPDGDHPIMDGKKHRVPVDGGKSGTLDGFYVGHLDGHPAGRIINNKTGTDITWKSKGYALSDEEKAKLQAEAATKLAEREAAQEQAHEATAQRVGRQMATLAPIEQPTPYLEAKGIKPQAGVLTDKEGQKTYIPVFDADGKQWAMQYIQEDGTKRFAKDSKKEGCFHPVGGMDALAAAPALVISEGYATAASNSEALGFATVAAFDSGNLPHVARALHEKYPDKPIIIAGDDDKAQELERGYNPGRAKAEEAAKAVGGKAIFPIFAPGEQAGDPKGFTDFNDLANKSELGREGVQRQVSTAVGKVLVDVGQQEKAQRIDQEQKREQKQEQRPRRAAKIG